MLSLQLIFTIFFLTLGPLKTIPVFYRIAGSADPKMRRRLALRATLFSLILVFGLALIGQQVLQRFGGVSIDALLLTGGLLLLISALGIILGVSEPHVPQTQSQLDERSLTAVAVSPLTVPTIVTPYGVVAIVLFMGIAQGNLALQLSVLALLGLTMGLNLLGMVFADSILKLVGIPVLLIVGWIFAVLQASLAVQWILTSLVQVGLL
jgi:multiple antibiotic resistance protein